MLPFPVHFPGETLPEPTRAPEAGEHTERVLAEVLGYDPERIEALRAKGAFG
jgi:crotonobetainyl-CoA:carnitine CoA-transferase CaiB-like acyl-CoA transferase